MKASTAVTADRLIDEIMGYRKAKVLTVASYLGIFDRLEPARTAREVARLLRLDARAVEIILDALVAMGYSFKRGGRYGNAPVSRRHLVSGRPGYLGDNLKYQEIIWDAWGELRQCVKKGGAVRPLDYWLLRHKGFTQEYIRGMDNIARGPAAEIAAALDPRSVHDMLDVGAGPGTYSLAFLRANPSLRATLLDLPTTLKVTRSMLAGHPGPRSRATLMPGDYRRADLGRASYDLILLSHITHDESPEVNMSLLRRSRRALRPGGRVVIHDFMLEPDRARPIFGALFSVHMLAYTQAGRTYTALEYRSWLRRAGFTSIRRRPIAASARNSTDILVATNPA